MNIVVTYWLVVDFLSGIISVWRYFFVNNKSINIGGGGEGRCVQGRFEENTWSLPLSFNLLQKCPVALVYGVDSLPRPAVFPLVCQSLKCSKLCYSEY